MYRRYHDFYSDIVLFFFFFFFNDTATTEIYTLSLHDALPISAPDPSERSERKVLGRRWHTRHVTTSRRGCPSQSSEIGRAHVELQSQFHLVCRLLLEKKKKKKKNKNKIYLKKVIICIRNIVNK